MQGGFFKNMIFKEFKNGKTALCGGDLILGTIHIIYLNEPGAYIKYLNVKAKYRKKGNGRLLMDFAISKAKLNRCESVSLYVETINNNAIDFYRHLGFFIALLTSPKGKVKAHYLMVKQLNYGT